jgi:RNA polymerase sigma-70 factor, ECF subfamily
VASQWVTATRAWNRQGETGMGWSGDWSALERLVTDELPAALAFAHRLTNDPDLAEEIVQEALFRAARAWATFRGDAQPRTWLFQIVVNVFRDQAGRHRPDDLPAELADGRMADPADLASANELGRRIARLVADLPPRQREVLVLMTYEKYTAGEVARLLGINEQNVHATLHVARERLRERLEPHQARR